MFKISKPSIRFTKSIQFSCKRTIYACEIGILELKLAKVTTLKNLDFYRIISLKNLHFEQIYYLNLKMMISQK